MAPSHDAGRRDGASQAFNPDPAPNSRSGQVRMSGEANFQEHSGANPEREALSLHGL